MAVIAARPIGVLMMEDESGVDEKLLCVPVDKLHPYYGCEVNSKSGRLFWIGCAFFEHYKDLKPNGQGSAGRPEKAAEMITAAIERAKG